MKFLNFKLTSYLVYNSDKFNFILDDVNNKFFEVNITNQEDEDDLKNLKNSFLYFYIKKDVRKRKMINKSKKNVTNNNNNNSLRRDKNVTMYNLFLKGILKNGLKCRYNKHSNFFLESFFFNLNNKNEDFLKYDNYEFFCFILKRNNCYNDINYILDLIIPTYNCIFDIKTKKNPKHLKSEKKYSHQIVYVPRGRRIKKSLKSMSFYIENYKNYFLWERLFWLFTFIIFNSKRSFLVKKREFIYKKSLKFFKRK